MKLTFLNFFVIEEGNGGEMGKDGNRQESMQTISLSHHHQINKPSYPNFNRFLAPTTIHDADRATSRLC